MVAYEFYWQDDIGGIHLLGILPERRKNPNRVTDQSILNWANRVIGDAFKNIFFTKVSIDDR